MKNFILFLILLNHKILFSSEQASSMLTIPSTTAHHQAQETTKNQKGGFGRQNNIECPINTPSLLNDPMIIAVEQLLQEPCTATITQNVLLTINPLIAQKSSRELLFLKQSVSEQIALHMLIEKLLQRCDTIIQNPYYGLTIRQEPYKLKPFQCFQNNSTKSDFIKLYRLIAKMQNNSFILPRRFDCTQYLTTTTYDQYFKHNKPEEDEDDNDDEQENPNIREYPVGIWIKSLISNLASRADALTQDFTTAQNRNLTDLLTRTHITQK